MCECMLLSHLMLLEDVLKIALLFLIPSLAWLIDPFLLAVVRGVWIPGSVLEAMADPLSADGSLSHSR